MSSSIAVEGSRSVEEQYGRTNEVSGEKPREGDGSTFLNSQTKS